MIDLGQRQRAPSLPQVLEHDQTAKHPESRWATLADNPPVETQHPLHLN